MKLLTILSILIILPSLAWCQRYEITTAQSNYDTLQHFSSIPTQELAANRDPIYWERTLPIGFSFPFYDVAYDSVIMDSDAYGFFPTNQNYSITLFAASYVIDDFVDTTYLASDVRYQNLTIGTEKAFVIEYHNVYNSDEYFDNGTNHYINFQIRLFESGKMELVFGAINLDSCSYYFPGKGFSYNKNNPDNEIYGPWVEIVKPNEIESATFGGDFNDPNIIYDDYDNSTVLTSIPPVGAIIRFTPVHQTTIEEAPSVQNQEFSISHDNNHLHVHSAAGKIESLKIWDIDGRLHKIEPSSTASIETLPAGIYLLQIWSTNKITTKRFIKY